MRNEAGNVCQYPVFDIKRFPKWPHMGPCGHTEPHTHDEDDE